MKATFSISSNELAKALAQVDKCMSPRPVQTILGYVKMELVNTVLTLTATNLGITASTSIGVTSKDSAGFCLEHATLSPLLKGRGNEVVTVLVQDTVARLTFAKGSYEVAVEEVKNFPTLSPSEGFTPIPVARDVFMEALADAQKFTTTDDVQHLDNISLGNNKGQLYAVATNQHSLYYQELGAITEELALLLPRSGAAFLTHTHYDAETFTVGYDDKMLRVSDSLNTVHILLTNGTYPNALRMLPNTDHGTTRFCCNHSGLMTVLARLSAIYSRLDDKMVVLDVAKDLVRVSSTNKAFNSEGVEEIAGSLEGEPLTIGFDASLLSRCLTVFTQDEVVLEMTAPNRYLVFRDDTALVIVMPRLVPEVAQQKKK